MLSPIGFEYNSSFWINFTPLCWDDLLADLGSFIQDHYSSSKLRSMTHILVTNDDGVTAPGLLALASEFRKLGEVTILAPDRNWSASGHVKTMHRPLRVKDVMLSDGTRAYASDGAPSDCVALALLGYIDKKIDLVVSGINPNANFGHDVTYSGTVTAAMEAVIHGVPGIAVSLDSPENHLSILDYEPAARAARKVASVFFEHGFPPEIVINFKCTFPGWKPN